MKAFHMLSRSLGRIPFYLRHRPILERNSRNFSGMSTSASPESVDLSKIEQEVKDIETQYALDMEQTPAESSEPWKALLAMPGRAPWRVTPLVPDPIRAALLTVIQGKKLRFVHGILEKILEQHKTVADLRVKERKRVVDKREYSSYEKRNDDNVQSVLYGPEETITHAYYRFVPHWSVARRALQEASSLIGPSWKPKKVLDFGMGCGSASAAAHDVFGDSIDWIHGIDPSQTMRECAKVMLEEITKGSEHKPQVTSSNHLETSVSSAGTFDLALFTYTAMEFTNNASTMAAAALLWEKLNDNGVLLMVEPGTPDGFRSVKSVRSMLLDCCKDECTIIAPCTHHGMCPMESFQVNNKAFKHERWQGGSPDSSKQVIRSGFCSFVQTMPMTDGKDEKFSYLVMQKKNPSTEPFDETCAPELMRKIHRARTEKDTPPEQIKTLNEEAEVLQSRYREGRTDPRGLDMLTNEERRKQFGRILHAPMKRRGHVLIDCCVSPGTVVRNKITKSTSKIFPGIYTASRKARWGGFWPDVPELQEKVN